MNNTSFRIVPQSGYRHIVWCEKRQKWQVRFSHAGIQHTLGTFPTVADARRVLKTFRRDHGYMDGLDAKEGTRLVRRFKESYGLVKGPRR
jgi:hypothetical protein